MNLRRFSLILLAFSIALMGLAVYLHQQKPEGPAHQPSAAAPAAKLPLASPATEPAATQPATSRPVAATRPAAATAAPATTQVAATQAATRPASTLKWFDDTRSSGATYTLGGLTPPKGEFKDDYLLQVEVLGKGAAIKTAKLADYYATVDDKQLARSSSDHQAYLDKVSQSDEYKGHYSLLNPVTSFSQTFLPLSTQTLTVQGEDGGGASIDANRFWRLAGSSQDDRSQSITFEATFYRGAGPADAKPALRVRKTYTVRKGSYSVEVSLRLENLVGEPLTVSLDQLGALGVPREDVQSDQRHAKVGRLKGDQDVQVKNAEADLGKMFLHQTADVGVSDGAESVLWLGQVNRFFGSMLYLVSEVEGRLEAPEYQASFYVAAAQETPNSRTYLTGVKMPQIKVAAGRPRDIRFDLYVGPKKRQIFVDKDYPLYNPLYQKLDYIGTIDLGSCFCAWHWLTLAMMWLLQTLSVVALGNYGVAIIVLVVLVRLALHPLTKKGQVSMSRMQKMGPEIQRLKEKYADDKETLNREMMDFYKKQGFSPVMGCLPMLLQMPIWIALWSGLQASVELRHAAFLPVWITDLSAPDSLIVWGTSLPGVGDRLNLLPILLTVAMFFQAKLQPTGVAATPDQARQQQMMKYMMPAMMLFIFYGMPSGLSLYVMASTFAGVAEQVIIRKHIQEREELEAATTVKVSGGGLRSSRPKKPKGPFWFKR